MARSFLDFVAESEGTEGHPRSRGYNTTLDYGRWTGGDVDLTKMTLNEVDALQKRMLAHPENRRKYKGPNGLSGSSALGRYQIVRKTLRGLRKELGLTGNELYSPELQDRLAERLATRRGRDAGSLRSEWEGRKRRDPGAILAAYDKGFRVADASGGFTPEQIRAELERRKGGTSNSPPQFSREEIEGELQRRLKIKEKETIGGLVEEVTARDPNVAADEEAIFQQRLAAAEADPQTPKGNEGATFSPSDLAVGTPLAFVLNQLKKAAPEYYQNLVDQAIKGSSFGFSDEIVGAANALAGGSEGESFSEEQARFTAAERDRAAKFSDENPIAAGAAEIAGGALALGPLAGAGVARAGTTAGKVAAGAAEGAIVGAAAGAGNADDGDRLAGAAAGAAGGAVLGGVLTRAGVSLERFLSARAAAKSAPSLKDLKAAGSQLLEQANKSGVIYKPGAVVTLRDDLFKAFDDELVTEGLHQKSFPLYKRIMKELGGGKPVTLPQLIRYRQLAADAAFEARKSKDGRLAKMIVEKLDDFSVDEANMLVAGKGAGQRREGAKVWLQYKKAETISEMIETAILRTEASGSGGNVNNAIRREFVKLSSNSKRMAGFNAEEREAIRQVVKQGVGPDTLRWIGKLSPSGNGLMLALHAGAAGAFAGASLPVAGAGMVAKGMADRITGKRAQAVFTTILNGGKVPRSTIAKLTKTERRSLANALAMKYGERVGEPITDPLLENLRTPEAVGIEP